jgi:hypothetical protein
VNWLLNKWKILFGGVAGAAVVALIGFLSKRWLGSKERPSGQLTAQGAKVEKLPVAGGSNISQTVTNAKGKYEAALKALVDSRNEPLNWLLGAVLTRHATLPSSHFLLDALEEPRGHFLASWNYWIEQFRAALVNPATAVERANSELLSEEKDPEGKLKSLMAEIFAVLHLRKLGYKNFEVALPEGRSTPDFYAELEGKKARIEVKNLRVPENLIQTVARARWKENRDRAPDKYNFRLLLRHSHHGYISPGAVSRLKTIIDQTSSTKHAVIDEELDGGVKIHIERLSQDSPPKPNVDGILLSQILEQKRNEGQLVIQSGIGEEDFDFNLTEFQALFIKALRVVADATVKFFGSAGGEDVINVLFLNWEPPRFLISDQEVEYSRSRIEALFADFQLDLKLVISYNPPEVPVHVLRGA